MKYTEFGSENDKILMIFPGGGVYWNPAAMPFVETASKQFHLIIVAYDGFNGEEKDAVISDDVLENSYEHEGNCAVFRWKNRCDVWLLRRRMDAIGNPES